MENLPIETLLPRLDLKEDVDIDGLIERLRTEEAVKHSVEIRAKRLYQSIQHLLNETEEIVSKMNEAMRHLKQLKLLKANSWADASKAYSKTFNEFSELLEENGFMRDTFYHEQLTIYQHYNEDATTEEEHRSNFKVDELYITAMLVQQRNRIEH
jgi:glutamate-1-semialdehyde aminotransferase